MGEYIHRGTWCTLKCQHDAKHVLDVKVMLKHLWIWIMYLMLSFEFLGARTINKHRIFTANFQDSTHFNHSVTHNDHSSLPANFLSRAYTNAGWWVVGTTGSYCGWLGDSWWPKRWCMAGSCETTPDSLLRETTIVRCFDRDYFIILKTTAKSAPKNISCWSGLRKPSLNALCCACEY